MPLCMGSNGSIRSKVPGSEVSPEQLEPTGTN